MEIENIDTEITKNKHHSYIEAMDQCPLCTTELEIIYSVEKVEAKVLEEAHCPTCKVKASNKEHPLQ